MPSGKEAGGNDNRRKDWVSKFTMLFTSEKSCSQSLCNFNSFICFNQKIVQDTRNWNYVNILNAFLRENVEGSVDLFTRSLEIPVNKS